MKATHLEERKICDVYAWAMRRIDEEQACGKASHYVNELGKLSLSDSQV